jgi:hypothetical protein
MANEKIFANNYSKYYAQMLTQVNAQAVTLV